MRKIAGAALTVTVLTLVAQAVSFVTQMVMASVFGAGANMDAFLAASAIPQYIIAVLLGSLGVVFVPVFIDYLATNREEEAWRVASSIINITLVALGLLVLLAVLFSHSILSLTAPGLTSDNRLLAVKIANITWPSVLATALISLLTGIYQSQFRFTWTAIVPVFGALTNLSIIWFLADRLGVIGLAIANTVGILIQAVLLMPLALKRGRFHLMLNLKHPGVKQVFNLLLPLVIANIVAKSTPVIDRYFASTMAEGSISHLGYAFRIFSVLSLLISTGIATVIFPRMAGDISTLDMANLRRSMSAGIRVMWLAIAPVMMIGIALALPLVTLLFRRGQFSSIDAVAVAGLIRIYLLALPPACLATVTGRGFYALKDTKTLGILGSIEAVVYVFYTSILSRSFGVSGVAFAYVIYFYISFLWQVLIIRFKIGNQGGQSMIDSFMRIGFAALLSGLVAWAAIQVLSNIWLQLFLGFSAGLVVYALGLMFLRVPEIKHIWNSF